MSGIVKKNLKKNDFQNRTIYKDFLLTFRIGNEVIENIFPKKEAMIYANPIIF